MRNLKRALSLALAAIMIIGMMVVGASAVDYKDFTDNGDIVNRDAVTMLTTLGVIDGKPDGTYAPTELVTRDQMAKMISVILNQGADVNDVYSNLDSGLTDISSNWAKGHINYCYTLGVIAGRGDGTFDPGANVTAAEAAKMLLVAAGYDPATEGFVGAQWSWNVNAKASSLGIYKNYTKGVLEPLNRDDAALLIYNALDIERIERYENGYARVYNDNRTILSSLYGVYKMIGVVTGNEWARLEGTGIDDALAAGKTTVSNPKILASETLQTQIFGAKEVNSRQFNVSTDLDMLGKAVTMFIRKETVLNNIEVLGVVYNEDLNNVVSVNSNKTKETDALKDTGLATKAGETAYYVNYGYVDDAAAAQARLGISKANANGIEMECIDNDDDGIVEYVLYLKEDLAVVSSVSKDGDKVVLRGVNDNDTISKDDMVTDLDLELDDVVLTIAFGGRHYIYAPEVVSGEMNSYTAKKDEEEAIEVDGKDYKPSAIGKLDQNYTSANGVGDIIDLDVKKCEEATGVNFGITYDFFLDSNGYMRAFRPTSQSLPDYALVINSGYDPGVYSSDASGKVTVLLADGSEGTYPINFSTSASNLAKQLDKEDDRAVNGVGGIYNASKSDRGVIELKGFLGTDYTDNSPTRPWRFEDTAANANEFQFAYNSDGVDEQARKQDYQSGQAAGYVIQYTLSENGVMTIKNVMGDVNTYSVNRGLTNNTQLSAAPVHTLSTMQNTLYTAYGSGSARVYWSAGQAVAVDKNTVAFYYDEIDSEKEIKEKYADRDVKVGDVLYGVAVGYDNMADVQKGTQFMASTVVRTTYNATTDKYEYDSTNLADVILFDEANILTARDYAFVLSANRRDSNNVTLNVLFEDGKAGTLVISRSNFDNIIGDEKENFLKPYAYTIDANDKATIYKGDPVGEGFVFRLKKETVAMDSVQRFWAYNINDVKIWDVTDASAGDDGVKLSDFAYQNSGISYKGYLILNTDGTVRTAFVWETDDKNTSVETGHSHDWNWKLSDNVQVLYDWASRASIRDAFDANKDVEIRGNWNGLSAGDSLYIPEGRILKIDGNMTVPNGVEIYGPGKLWVTGNVTTSGTLNLSVGGVQIEKKLTLGGNTNIASLMRVGGDLDAATFNVTIATDGDVHVGGKVSGTGTLTIAKTNGHLEVAGDLDMTTVQVYSDSTLIVNGMLKATTLTIGDGTTDGAGKVMAKDSVKVTNLNITANSVLDHDAPNGGVDALEIATTLSTDAKSTLSSTYVKIASNVTIKGTVDIGVLEIADGVTVTADGVKGEIGKVAYGASKTGVLEYKAGSKNELDILDSTATSNVKGEVSGTIAGGVTVATGGATVVEKAETTVGGTVDVGDNTLAVKGTLTLNGGLTAGSDGTGSGKVEVAATGKVEVNNGESETAVDVSKITIPTLADDDAINAYKGTISFAADAKLTVATGTELGDLDPAYYTKEGTKITNVNDLRGLTFELTTVSAVEALAPQTGESTGAAWIATTAAPADTTETAKLGGFSAGDYTISTDANVVTITAENGKVVTLTVQKASNQTVGILKGDQEVTVDGNMEKTGSNTFKITAQADDTFTLIVKQEGLKNGTYTIKVKDPTA